MCEQKQHSVVICLPVHHHHLENKSSRDRGVDLHGVDRIPDSTYTSTLRASTVKHLVLYRPAARQCYNLKDFQKVTCSLALRNV